MKNTHCFLIVAAALALFASVDQARAGSSSCCAACADDGITASPKVRAMLDDRKACSMASAQVAAAYQTTSHTTVAASPKVQQMRNDRIGAGTLEVAPETAGYRATGTDGVTASPKVRARLDERNQVIEIAPLK
jgi:hypothetical protein